MHNGKAFFGFKKCPEWLKQKFKEAVNFKCQNCGIKESKNNILEIHRPKREVDGGLYMCVYLNHPLSNVKVLCKKCHKIFNYSPRIGSY